MDDKKDRIQKISQSYRDKIAMPTILENVPSGVDWGFFSREDERMHLQTVDEEHRYGPNKYKVWLENSGKRIFQPVNVPKKVLNSLIKSFKNNWERVEYKWVQLMIDQGWIDVQYYEPLVVLRMYPGTHNEYQRIVDLSKEIPGRYKDITEDQVGLDRKYCFLAIGDQNDRSDQFNMELPKIVFEGSYPI